MKSIGLAEAFDPVMLKPAAILTTISDPGVDFIPQRGCGAYAFSFIMCPGPEGSHVSCRERLVACSWMFEALDYFSLCNADPNGFEKLFALATCLIGLSSLIGVRTLPACVILQIDSNSIKPVDGPRHTVGRQQDDSV